MHIAQNQWLNFATCPRMDIMKNVFHILSLFFCCSVVFVADVVDAAVAALLSLLLLRLTTINDDIKDA